VSIIKQLHEVGALLGLDCGDNSCLFAKDKGGMCTNGGCQCDLVRAVEDLESYIIELQETIEARP
jgi:hypothetical protein